MIMLRDRLNYSSVMGWTKGGYKDILKVYL